MKVLICSLLFSLFAVTNLYSQHTSIKVNGLELGQTYTDSQIRDSLGIPTSVIPPSEDDVVPGVTVYLYNNNVFIFQNGTLTDFAIKSNQFKINNYLTMGMNFSAITQMGGILTPSNTFGLYYWYPDENYRTQKGYAKIRVNTIDNKILSINIESSILAL